MALTDLKNEIRKILEKPPTKQEKCSCNGYKVWMGRNEPDGPNASDYGNKIYERCCSGVKTVEDTEKMIERIIEACRENK
jgi:hypothetical protein